MRFQVVGFFLGGGGGGGGVVQSSRSLGHFEVFLAKNSTKCHIKDYSFQ